MHEAAHIENEFGELFKKNHSRLFYYALDWVEDTEAAKDLVSETFYETWKQYERLRQTAVGEQMEAYLFRTLRNRAINHLKHKSIEIQYQQQFLQVKEEAIDEDINAHEEHLQLIEQTLNSLSAQTRFIFEQCYYEGKKYQELADLMGISPSAIHKHMNKAFTAFRKAFEQTKDKKEKNRGNRFYSWLFLI